jgi:hypothetical protein
MVKPFSPEMAFKTKAYPLPPGKARMMGSTLTILSLDERSFSHPKAGEDHSLLAIDLINDPGKQARATHNIAALAWS